MFLHYIVDTSSEVAEHDFMFIISLFLIYQLYGLLCKKRMVQTINSWRPLTGIKHQHSLKICKNKSINKYNSINSSIFLTNNNIKPPLLNHLHIHPALDKDQLVALQFYVENDLLVLEYLLAIDLIEEYQLTC